MFHNLMGYITNIALAAFLGFLINVGLDMQSIYDLSLIHISEPTRPY